MEIKEILKKDSIVGIVSNYKSNLDLVGKVKDLEVKNIAKALKIVGLDETFLDKDLNELTISELWKIDLLKKLDKDIIIVGNLYNSLIHKDREYIKKLFKKLVDNYNKKIIIIDNNINSFMGITKKIVVIKNKNVIYDTDNFFDNKLYEYVSVPKIVDFIKYTNRNGKKIDETMDIYELIKDIYRRIS